MEEHEREQDEAENRSFIGSFSYRNISYAEVGHGVIYQTADTLLSVGLSVCLPACLCYIMWRS